MILKQMQKKSKECEFGGESNHQLNCYKHLIHRNAAEEIPP